jgi:hypothetical protein
MTRPPDFNGVWVKVERAKEHIGNLEARVESFKQSDPYGVASYCELDTGDLVFEAKASDQPPLWWSGLVGDAVHNLRSSLDLLVCEMIRAEGNAVQSNSGFPVFKSATACANAFNPGLPGQVKGAPQSAIDLIKAANPYKGANNAFWRLHQLDITDKHKLLVPVGMAQGVIIHDILRILALNPDLADKLTTPQKLGLPRDASIPKRRFPLPDGTEIYRVPARGRDDLMTQMRMYPEFTFEVAFGEGEVVKGEPLFPALYELAQFVEGFIKSVEVLFSQPSTPCFVPTSRG